MLKLLKNWLPDKPSLRFDTATLNQIGGRDNLEDAVGQAMPNPHSGCWVVADGVGGQGAGEVVSQLAVATILQGFRAQAACSASGLSGLLDAAHQAIFAARQPDTPTVNMATTVVALLAADNRAVWGHVGDSRLYHFRSGKILHRTEDQSLVNMLLARGALQEADIAGFAQRNVILHALGQDKPLEIAIHGPVTIKAGDGFLLCTDGVWELASDDELLASWHGSDSASAWIAGLQQLLEPRAAKKNTTDKPADNYSALAIKLVAQRG